MLKLKYMAIAMACCGIFSCTRHAAMDPDNADAEGLPTTRVTLITEPGDLSVFYFRKYTSGNYRYEGVLNSGWIYDMSGNTFINNAYLTVGDYKFLFARNHGNTLKMDPGPTYGMTFDQIRFKLDPATEGNGYYKDADELFLQDLTALNGSVPVITLPADNPVEAKLKRVVGRIDVNLNQGLPDNSGGYDPVVFATGKDIFDVIRKVEIEVDGIGTEVDLTGSYGSGKIKFAREESDPHEINTSGFAEFEGPFAIPPASGDVTVTAKVTLAGGEVKNVTMSDQKGFVKNQRLVINIWVAPGFEPLFNLSLSTEEFTTVDGDSGMWE